MPKSTHPSHCNKADVPDLEDFEFQLAVLPKQNLFQTPHKPACKINAFRHLVTLKGVYFTWRCMGRL